MAFPALDFITSDPSESDYRPAVDATGGHVIFERTHVGGGHTTLFIASVAMPHDPTPFIHDLVGVHVDTGPSQTRPDWCCTTGQVALNVAATNAGPVRVL